jgi:four helix bundle protein
VVKAPDGEVVGELLGDGEIVDGDEGIVEEPVAEVYAVTRGFPADERFGLTAELRKTVRSVPYNIAEGHKRRSTADYLRFLAFAAGSGGELETQLLLAERLQYLDDNQAADLLGHYREVERMLAGLIRSLERK